jgi:hypothetical protein
MPPPTPRAPAVALPTTPWDARLFARTLLLAAALGALVLGVGAATDEQGARWPDRLVRLGALAPAWTGAAFALTKSQAVRRGEGRALALLGLSPRRQWAGAWAAASGLGLLFALALLAPEAPLRSLFPALEPSPWRRAGERFEAPALGMQWTPPSERFAFAAPLVDPRPGPPRPWLAAALAALAVAVPAWLALTAPAAERFAVGLASVAAALFAFHFVARDAPGAWLLAAPALLAADLARLEARARALPFGLHSRPPCPTNPTERPPRGPAAAAAPPGACSSTAAPATCRPPSATRTPPAAARRSPAPPTCSHAAARPSTRCRPPSKTSKTTRASTPAPAPASTPTANCVSTRPL